MTIHTLKSLIYMINKKKKIIKFNKNEIRVNLFIADSDTAPLGKIT